MQNKEKKVLKIYVVGGDNIYASWIKQEYEIIKRLEDADLVIFTGGEDVNPSLYNVEPHRTTYFNGVRDLYEEIEFNKAVKLGKFITGICRGAQFTSVMSGAKLIQHMSHPHYHEINCSNGEHYEVISTHHQLQYPFGLPDEDYTLYGWAENLSPFHWIDNTLNLPEMSKEAEIVKYHKTNCLSIQSHPELMDKNSPFVNYLNDLLNSFLKGELNLTQTSN